MVLKHLRHKHHNKWVPDERTNDLFYWNFKNSGGVYSSNIRDLLFLLTLNWNAESC